MDLQGIISEMSQTGKGKYSLICYIRNLKVLNSQTWRTDWWSPVAESGGNAELLVKELGLSVVSEQVLRVSWRGACSWSTELSVTVRLKIMFSS